MGSSGTGNFSDYSGYKPQNNGDQGGSSDEEKCNKAFSTRLDEVEPSQYFDTHNSVPPVDTRVSISFNSRLEVYTDNMLLVGYLPTKYNYLAVCIQNGFSYVGTVSSSSNDPIASVEVDIVPQQ